MAETMDDLGMLLNRAGQAWQRRAGAALRPTGLTYAQFLLLEALAQNPGFSQAGVAQRAGIDPMSASVAFRNLERRRLVGRRVSAVDSRAKLLSLSASGAAALEEARGRMAAAEAAFFAGVGTAGRELAAVLGALSGQRVRVRVAMGRGGA
jgi:DNA-binding MarR family transcriptional regulator